MDVFWQFSIEPERKAGSGRPKYSTELIWNSTLFYVQGTPAGLLYTVAC